MLCSPLPVPHISSRSFYASSRNRKNTEAESTFRRNSRNTCRSVLSRIALPSCSSKTSPVTRSRPPPALLFEFPRLFRRKDRRVPQVAIQFIHVLSAPVDLVYIDKIALERILVNREIWSWRECDISEIGMYVFSLLYPNRQFRSSGQTQLIWSKNATVEASTLSTTSSWFCRSIRRATSCSWARCT